MIRLNLFYNLSPYIKKNNKTKQKKNKNKNKIKQVRLHGDKPNQNSFSWFQS